MAGIEPARFIQPQDFKSCASASSATSAFIYLNWFVLTTIVIIILYFLKKKALTLRYTLLWLLSGAVMGIMVVWPEILSWIIGLVGIQSNMNGLFVMAIGFVIIILMSLTSIATKQRQKIKTMIQEMGMLEARVRQLEKVIENSKDI